MSEARLTEAEVVALHDACRAEDVATQEGAYQRLGGLLYRIVWQRVAATPELHELAADCTQEALVTIWQRLAAGQGPASAEHFVAWAAVIAVNKLREDLRRRNPSGEKRPTKRVAERHVLSLDAPVADDSLPIGERLRSADDSPEDVVAQSDLARLVATIPEVPGVSDASRTVLLYGYIGDWSDQELARHLSTTPANVQVIRSRDLAKLRQSADFAARAREAMGGA